MDNIIIASPASFVAGTNRNKILLIANGESIEYSVGECIKFMSNWEAREGGFKELIGKISLFGHQHDSVTEIFIQLWDDALGKWELRPYSIEVVDRLGSNPIGNYKTIRKMDKCPIPSQGGGRRRNYHRRPSRKVRSTRHRKTRKYRL